MKSQLLCTFTDKKTLTNTVQQIKSNYNILFNKVYVLQNENVVNELFCTYNVDISKAAVDYNAVENTISLHRKKHSNTLYTINALNEVISNFNNGVVKNDFIVPWENFKNTLLVINSNGLNRISTRIYKIIEI